MRNVWSWLGLNLGKRAGTVSLIGLLLTVGLGVGLTRLTFATSNASYLNANDKAQIENHQYEQLFGGDPVVVMFTMKPGTTIDNLFTPGNIAQLTAVQRKLSADPSVFNVVTPLDALKLSDALITSPNGNPTDSPAAQLLLSAYERDPSPAGKRARLAEIDAQLAAESAIPPAQRVISNPTWMHFVIHDSNGTVRQ